MSQMTELREQVRAMKDTASGIVQRHAAYRAPDVSLEFVAAICNALGEISVDEAIETLDRLQLEAVPPSPAPKEPI